MEGFNADDLVRVLLPDLAGIDASVLTISVALAICLVYWEGGSILRALRERRRRREAAARHGGTEAGVAAEEEEALRHQRDMREELGHQRDRGLSWLALATAVAVWLTGVLNKPNAFMP